MISDVCVVLLPFHIGTGQKKDAHHSRSKMWSRQMIYTYSKERERKRREACSSLQASVVKISSLFNRGLIRLMSASRRLTKGVPSC